MSGFEKDCVYYRANINYRSGVETSGYLGDNNIDADKLAVELKMFVESIDSRTFDITKHVAKKGDSLAHVDSVVIKLYKRNNRIYVDK